MESEELIAENKMNSLYVEIANLEKKNGELGFILKLIIILLII